MPKGIVFVMRISLFMYAALAVLLGLGVAGCGKSGPTTHSGPLTLKPGVFQTNEVVRSYKDLLPEGVLVQVGTHRLTRTDFEEAVGERLALYRKTGPRLSEQDEKGQEREALDFVFANFMARAAMLTEAEKRGITHTEADLKDAENYINQLCGRLRVKRAAFANRFPGGEADVARRIREEAMLKALLREQFGPLFNVSDADAQGLKAELERLRDQVQVTNKVLRAALSRVREQVVSGDLKVTDDRASMQAAMPKGVVFDGVVSSSAFDLSFPETRQALTVLKPGEWSPVVDLDESFELYQLRSVEPNEDKDLTVYTFVKISIPRELGWYVPEIAQLKRDLANNRRKERQAPWVRELMTKAGVLYPNGVQLFGPSSESTQKAGEKGKTSAQSGLKEKK